MSIQEAARQHGLILPNRRLILQGLAVAAASAWFRPVVADDGGPEPLPPDAMTPVHERYGALKSYADTGKIETRYQWPDTPETTGHYRFETAFRAPRNFFFRFDTEEDTGDDVFVIWCDGGDFQSWWKATGVHDVWDGGRGATAFLTGGSPTRESANLLGPHIFGQAILYGPTSRLIDLKEDGEEDIGGHACARLVASGRQTGVVTSETRPITVWVDKDLTLVRKAQIEADAGSPKGLVDTTTYVIEPVADPDIPDERFTFTPPA